MNRSIDCPLLNVPTFYFFLSFHQRWLPLFIIIIITIENKRREKVFKIHKRLIVDCVQCIGSGEKNKQQEKPEQ